MTEAQCAVTETAIRGAEPGPVEVKITSRPVQRTGETNHNVITVMLAGVLSL